MSPGRRPVARWVAVVLVLLAVGTAGWWWTRPDAFTIARTPDRNVLLISIDTLRADALGAYGGRAATPHLDALANSGARFTFAHAHAVVTLPSHTSLLTGRYPFQHGVRDNNGYRVRTGERTLATRLKALGFATGAFVGAFPLDQRFGLNQGFDAYDDRLPEAGQSVDFSLPERRADEVVSAARAWIGAQPDRWFSWVHVFDPHAPYRAPEPFGSRYAADPYAGEVAWTDAALAPLLDQLRSQPRPTLVIVTADHGESLGEHGELTHGIFAYDATLRVPLLIAEVVPDAPAEPRGRVIDAQVRHVDVVPTVLDALGADSTDEVEGSSLLDVVASGSGNDRPAYFEAMTAYLSRGWAPLRGVLVGRDKYIDLPLPERYALDTDPDERRNIVETDPTRLQVLRNTLRTFDVSPPGQPGEETGEVLARLRALGYIGGSPTPRSTDGFTDDDDPKRLIDLDRMLHDAGDAYSRGRIAEAISGFEGVIARRPDTADAYRYLAFVLWQTGRAGDAIRVLESALAQGLTQRDIRVKLGLYLAETGQADRAIALLEDMSDQDSEVLNALGIAYGQRGREADAMRTFQRALVIDSTSGLSHQNIATLHLRAGRLTDAEAAFRQALEIDDTLPGAHTGLGVVLAQRNRVGDALNAWRRAVALDPAEFNALFNLTIALFDAGQTAEARRYGEQFMASAPQALFGPDIARIRQLLAGGRLRP